MPDEEKQEQEKPEEEGAEKEENSKDEKSDEDKKKSKKKEEKKPKTNQELAAEFKKVAKKYLEKLEGDITYFEKRKEVFENLAKLCRNNPKRYAKVIERLVEFG